MWAAPASRPITGHATGSGPAQFHPLVPARIVDTRSGIGGHNGPLGERQSMGLPLAGHPPVPAGASAVVLNLTVTNPSAWSYIAVYPSGGAVPDSSNINFRPYTVVANLVTVSLGPDGGINFYNAVGQADVIADLQGYFESPISGTSGLFRSLPPARIADTRTGLGGWSGQLGPGQAATFQVTGRGGVPASGVGAAVLNLTAIMPTETTYLTAFPADQPPPNASTVNCLAQSIVANRAMIRLSPDGRVTVKNSVGAVHLAVDVAGWFTDGSDGSATGGAFNALPPTRILDTRNGIGAPIQPITDHSRLVWQVGGRGGVPASGVGSAVMNLTATNITAPSLISAYPGGSWLPLASDVNFFPGQIQAGLAITRLGPDGSLAVHNENGSIDLVVDVEGWFDQAPGGTASPGAPALTGAAPISRSQITVSWNSPGDAGGGPLLSYTVIMQPGYREWSVDSGVGALTIGGLICNSAYSFQVVASNAGGGSGALSAGSGPITPPCPTSNVITGVPFFWQVYALSCEEAALQMVLAYEGINVNQAQILDAIGIDWRHGYYDGNGLRWGDAYHVFVGNPSGAEYDLSGYGTYWPAITGAAFHFGGYPLRAGEGISPQDVYQAVLDNHPVEVWVTWDWAFHARHDYLSFDGQWIIYAGPIEHAMTMVGVSPDSVLVHDPDRGTYWLPKSTFEAGYATYNHMAVIFN